MEDRIRICFVSFEFSPLIGGAQARAEKQAKQLQALGHDVTVVTLRHNRNWKRAETLDGLRVVRVGGIYSRGGRLRTGKLGHFPVDITMFLALWRLRHSYDVIHIIQISPLAAMATLIGELTQKPAIISVQNAGPGEPQLAQLKRGATLMADTLPRTSFLNVDFMDWVIGASEITNLPLTALGGKAILNYLRKSNAIYQVLSTGGQSYLTSHGFRASQIVHIPGSVDTQKFRPAPQRRPDPSRPERDIICVASLDYRKGIDVLLHTWGRMMSAPTEWRTSMKPQLLLVGEGKIRPQLERIVAQLGIAESVEFLGARTDIVDLLQRAWCFVLPSRWEGMPNALLEAMACGLPCVATRVSGCEDIITNGINGLLLEPERPAELAQALQRIIEDTNLAQRLGQEARATVVRDYQLPMIVEQCLQLYRGLLSAGKNRNDEKRHPEGYHYKRHGREESWMNKPRIYITIGTFHPVIGGAEKQALMQGRSLRERGYEATIITFHHDKAWPAREVIEGVPVIRVAGTLLGRRKKLPRLLQKLLYPVALMVLGWTLWLHRRHYDILHVYQLTLLALPTALVCRLNGKAMVIVLCSADSGKVAKSQNKASLVAGPLVATLPWLQVEVDAKNFGDLKDLERLGKPVVQLTRSLLQSIGASVIVLSSRMQRYLTQQDFHLPGTHRIPNGVDITRFTPPRISLDARAQVVVCISRLSYEKGIDVLLQAWHLVHKQAAQARLIIVGGGPIQAQLELLAQALDNLGSVEFAGAQSDIQAQLHRGSLAVLPSRWEGMPNAVLEAMACGMPCVATRVSGSEDIILHGVNGLLVEPEDYQGMAQALLTLLRDPGLVQKYGQAARATIEQHYSLEDITDTYIELYRSIADHSWQIAEDIPSPEVYHPPL